MTDEPHDTPDATPPENHAPEPPPPQQPQRQLSAFDIIPKKFIYAVVGIVIASFAITLFVSNPYTAAVQEGSSYYEGGGSMDRNLMLWVAIFIGIPASFWAYKKWILPLFDK